MGKYRNYPRSANNSLLMRLLGYVLLHLLFDLSLIG